MAYVELLWAAKNIFNQVIAPSAVVNIDVPILGGLVDGDVVFLDMWIYSTPFGGTNPNTLSPPEFSSGNNIPPDQNINPPASTPVEYHKNHIVGGMGDLHPPLTGSTTLNITQNVNQRTVTAIIHTHAWRGIDLVPMFPGSEILVFGPNTVQGYFGDTWAWPGGTRVISISKTGPSIGDVVLEDAIGPLSALVGTVYTETSGSVVIPAGLRYIFGSDPPPPPGPSVDRFIISMAEGWGGADQELGLDAIWAIVEGGSTADVTEMPLFAGDQIEDSGLYQTRYGYVPGSLAIWWEGIRLRPGIDFVEIDPEEGTFRILDKRDLSAGLIIEYKRAGAQRLPRTGGNVRGIYRPAPQLQYGWGTALDGFNCTMACSAMALDRHTLGRFTAFRGSPRNTPPNHRANQDDQREGVSLDGAAVAWQRGWDQTLQHIGSHTWDQFVALVEEGRGAILRGTYGNLPKRLRFSDTFGGGHGIYINEILPSGSFYGIDPLYRYPVVYSPNELMNYALGFTAPARVNAAFTRIAI